MQSLLLKQIYGIDLNEIILYYFLIERKVYWSIGQ
jgi:hypothetical protein